MASTGLAETIIENEVGCGLFQVLIVIFVFIFLRISAVFTFIFMSFGNYNPGWRCLENDTNHYSLQANVSQTSHSALYPNASSLVYSKDLTCEEFEACKVVEFNPESVTVVTQWGLICNRAWISSFIISIQMIGNLISSVFAGYIIDRLGRWKTAYGSLFINSILTLLSSFSPSWEMLAACRFFIGLTSAVFESIIYLYSAEFLTRRWRGPLSGIPGWAFGGVLFGVTSMVLKNWRHLLIASSVVCFVGCLPAFWVPESLRWLEVKGKKDQFKRAAMKISKFNKKTLHEKYYSELFSLDCDRKSKITTTTREAAATAKTITTTAAAATTTKTTTTDSETRKLKHYTILDLFHKGYKMITLIVGFVWMSISFIYYAISFGVKALSGNFYINLIMLYSIVIPFAIFPFFAPNLLGRKKSSCFFILIVSACLLTATVVERFTIGETRIIVTLALVLMAEVGIETTWCIQQVQTNELFPTVVRGMALNWASLMARVGGIVAPFLIPRDSSTVYQWYLMMGVQGLLCCFLLSRLPETKGKPLKETFSIKSLDLEINEVIDCQDCGDNDDNKYDG